MSGNCILAGHNSTILSYFEIALILFKYWMNKQYKNPISWSVLTRAKIIKLLSYFIKIKIVWKKRRDSGEGADYFYGALLTTAQFWICPCTTEPGAVAEDKKVSLFKNFESYVIYGNGGYACNRRHRWTWTWHFHIFVIPLQNFIGTQSKKRKPMQILLMSVTFSKVLRIIIGRQNDWMSEELTQDFDLLLNSSTYRWTTKHHKRVTA